MARILILAEPDDRTLFQYHLLRPIAQRWRRLGHDVNVHTDPAHLPGADLAILHVDRSVVPPAYVEAAQRFPKAVNAGVVDIRKHTYSTLMLRQDEDYAGPVIVKSVLNSGGRPERIKQELVARRQVGATDPHIAVLKGTYPVYESARAVPAQLWSDPALLVEKLVTETSKEGYCLRCYYFLGDAEFNLLLHSSEKVVKTGTVGSVERSPVPGKLRALRHRMGFGYGKFDYILRDGEPVLFDANRTPARLLLETHGLVAEAADRLAAGLAGLLAG